MVGHITKTHDSGKWARSLATALLAVAGMAVAAALVWQGVTEGGSPPDPTQLSTHISHGAVILNTGLLVFREGLEAILVLAALTASLMGANYNYRRPIALGAGVAFLASIATWYIAIALLDATKLPALDIQAATGLLAIVVLLVIMNWFFHKVYWTGWISMHNKKRRSLLGDAAGDPRRVAMGLGLLGFSAMYREGFEVVLFLQTLRIQAGSAVVLQGVAIGLAFTSVVAVLTFVLHHRMSYKKMLVVTGGLLAGVLMVMVGESVQEMQQAQWISTTSMHLAIPDWMGLWFAVFPNWEGIAAQLCAGAFVIGSYFLARYLQVWQPRKRGEKGAVRSESPPDAGKARHALSHH